MPIKKSAEKALRQSKKRAERNLKYKATINWLRRQFLKAIQIKNKEQATGLYLKIQKAVDKAVQKGVLKKNTASRKKSRFAKKISSLK